MAFGSVTSSKVKIILEAQDNVTATLNKLKANFAKADQEMQATLQRRTDAWTQQHAQSFTSHYKHLSGPNGNYLTRMSEQWDEKRMSAWYKDGRFISQGFYNPFVSSAHILAALQSQGNKLYKNAQIFTDRLISVNQWMTKASAKLFEVGGKLSMAGGVMTGAGIAGLTSLYKPLSQFGDFQRNMLEAQVKSGASAAQYNAMTGAARQYAANSSWDPQQVSSVMAKMSSMGFKPDQITNSFRQIMDYSRAVGQDDPMWAAQGIGAMMNSFGINAADSAGVSKVIDKMTAAIVNSPLRDDTLREAMKQVAPLVKDKQGTIDDMLAWNMVMAQKGIDGSIAGTAQKNFLMRTGNSKIVDYLGKFGIAVFDDAGNRRSARQILADIAQIKKVMTDKEWDAFAFKVFGARSQSGIGAMFDDDALENAYSALADAEGLSKQIREQMESGVFGSLKRIWSALQDMFLEVGKSLENLLKEWEPKFIAWMHWATEMVGDNPRFVKWLADAYAWMVQIGIPLTAIGASLMVIGGVLSGFQTIISFIMMACKHVIYPVIVGIGKALGWIFITFGGIGSLLVLVLAAIVGLVAWTGDWGKILTGIFNGGGILNGIKLMGRSFVMVFKQAGVDIYYSLKYAFNKVLTYLWNGVKMIGVGLLKALSYVPGLGKLDEVANSIAIQTDWESGDKEISREWTQRRKEVENEYKQYLADVEKYKNDAAAKNTSEASDVEKRGKPVAMPAPKNDDLVLAQRQQREAEADAKWAIYFPGTQRPAELEQAEKEIEKYEKAEEKRRRALVDAAFESDKSAEKEEKAAAKKEESERKKAAAEARSKAEEERKAKEFKTNQLKRQAELTKGMKPLFQGSLDATKWLHNLGEYSKGGKTEMELQERQVDLLASIDETLSNGEVMFAGV